MSFFDQPYYAIDKAHMCQQGIWPEQSKYVRIIRPLMIFVTIMTLVGPQLVRLHVMWRNVETIKRSIPQLLSVIINFSTILNSMLKADKMKLMLEKMKEHWKMFENTSAVIVLDKYAERGRYLTIVYAIFVYTMLTLYLIAPILPIILDFVDPLNETRPKDYIYKAEYGVDPDPYYWFILAHSYIVAILNIHALVAIDTMYIMWVEHACALFEVVGFASMIESIYSGSFVVVIGATTIGISFIGVEAVNNMGSTNVLIRVPTFSFGQIFHVYFNSIPGQKLIDHSIKLHTNAYDLNWYDMSVKAQKLLILILIRSNKPCLLTAGKIYVLSIESFGSVMQTAVSYFRIIAQML